MTLPNILTTFRLLLVPLFIYVYLQNPAANHTAAIIIFAVALATDILDGYIARTFKMTTKLGAILDPVADKLMQISVLACLCYLGLFPLWALLILMVKEAIMTVGTLISLRDGIEVTANVFGKSATVIISASILSIFIFTQYVEAYIDQLAATSSIASVCALISYIISFYHSKKESKSATNP